MTPEPLSARNPRVARLGRLVRRREERDAAALLVVEGPVLVAAALDAGLAVTEIYVDAGSLERPGVVALMADARLGGVESWSLPAGALDRIGDVATSQGVVALVRRSPAAWPDPTAAPFVVVLAEVADPGNVGTLIRTAGASGAGAVVAVGGADPHGPKAIRASAGAAFALPVVAAPPPVGAAVGRLRTAGYRVVATVARGGVAHHAADLTGPVALLLGNEAHGLDPEVAAAADLAVTIPLAPAVESLNVAAAAAVVCFEVARPRP